LHLQQSLIGSKNVVCLGYGQMVARYSAIFLPVMIAHEQKLVHITNIIKLILISNSSKKEFFFDSLSFAQRQNTYYVDVGFKDHYQSPIHQFYAPKNSEITSAFNKLRCLKTPLMKPFYTLKIELLWFCRGCSSGTGVSGRF